MPKKVASKKKKKDIRIVHGVLHVSTSHNNTVVTLTDKKGNKVLGWGTGLKGFKGAKQNTPYATEVLTKDILQEAKGYGLEQVGIIFKWLGMGREGVFKAINETGIVEIEYIREKTWIQFGGCKGKRPKRN